RQHRGRQRHRHPAWEAAEAREAYRLLRAAGAADRFRVARRAAGRPGLPAARARRRRRRSPQGARARGAAAAPGRRGGEAARDARRRSALRRAGAAVIGSRVGRGLTKTRSSAWDLSRTFLLDRRIAGFDPSPTLPFRQTGNAHTLIDTLALGEESRIVA